MLRSTRGETRKGGKILPHRGRRVLYHYVHPQALKRASWGFAADILRYARQQEATLALLGTKTESAEQTYAVPLGFFASYGEVADRGAWGLSVLLPSGLWEPLFEAFPYLEAPEKEIAATQTPWMGDGSTLIIHTDGGMVGGNPGPIGGGVVIYDAYENHLDTLSRPLGYGTNNEAEYGALVAALEAAVERGAHRVYLRSDSELMVKQMRGEYATKDAKIKPLHKKAKELAGQIPVFEIRWVPRGDNQAADEAAAAGAALNAQQASLL